MLFYKDLRKNCRIYLNRQIDLELRSLSRFTGDADAPAMLLDDLLHDGEAETSAAFFSREERFEDSIASRLIHSFTVVRNRDTCVTARRLSIAVSFRRQQLCRDQHL